MTQKTRICTTVCLSGLEKTKIEIKASIQPYIRRNGLKIGIIVSKRRRSLIKSFIVDRKLSGQDSSRLTLSPSDYGSRGSAHVQ